MFLNNILKALFLLLCLVTALPAIAKKDDGKQMQTKADSSGAIKRLNLQTPQIPVMHRVDHNRSLGMNFELSNKLRAETEVKLKGIAISFKGTTNLKDIDSVALAVQVGGIHANTHELGRSNGLDRGQAQIRLDHVIKPDETIWVAPILKKGASLDNYVCAQIDKVIYTVGSSSKKYTYKPGDNTSKRQKIGYAIMKPGDLKSFTFRIPGITTTKAGSMLAVTDIRYPEKAKDLPEDMDVGISKSEDNGQTWTPVKVIMDMGPGKNHGIGDPTILVDYETGRIFVAALYSFGNRGWFGSGPGMTPKETGQFMMVHSDNDGKTWSKPYSITPQVKDPKWHLCFNGPGRGIQLKDGTLVMPAQFKDENKVAHSTIIYSKDQGETWEIGTGVRKNTSESQVEQLEDGSILISVRDENKPGKRSFFYTENLGETWKSHTASKKLSCPTCQASILNLLDHPRQRDLLIQANPGRPSNRRYDIALSLSEDEGKSWKTFIPVDERGLLGYTCMTLSKDRKYLGLFYEGTGQMYFVRYKVEELLKQDKL